MLNSKAETPRAREQPKEEGDTRALEVEEDVQDVQLVDAAKCERTESVQTRLAAAENIDAEDDSRDTALIVAATSGHTEVVHALIEQGANVNAENDSHDTALIVAANSGHTEIVHALIEHGANINAENDSCDTALIVAANSGHTEIVHALIEHGANDSNASAFHAATLSGHTEIAQALVAMRKTRVTLNVYDARVPQHKMPVLLDYDGDGTLTIGFDQIVRDAAHRLFVEPTDVEGLIFDLGEKQRLLAVLGDKFESDWTHKHEWPAEVTLNIPRDSKAGDTRVLIMTGNHEGPMGRCTGLAKDAKLRISRRCNPLPCCALNSPDTKFGSAQARALHKVLEALRKNGRQQDSITVDVAVQFTLPVLERRRNRRLFEWILGIILATTFTLYAVHEHGNALVYRMQKSVQDVACGSLAIETSQSPDQRGRQPRSVVESVRSAADFCPWMIDAFTNSVYDSHFRLSSVIPSPRNLLREGFILDGAAMIVGGIRVSQVRSKRSYTLCHNEAMASALAGTRACSATLHNHHLAWKFQGDLVENTPFTADNGQVYNFTPGKTKIYNSALRLHYEDAGFSFELPQGNGTAALTTLRQHCGNASRSGFIDQQTRALLVDFSVYSFSLDNMCHGQIIVDLPASGGAFPRCVVTPMSMKNLVRPWHQSSWRVCQWVATLILMLKLLISMGQTLRRELKRYWFRWERKQKAEQAKEEHNENVRKASILSPVKRAPVAEQQAVAQQSASDSSPVRQAAVEQHLEDCERARAAPTVSTSPTQEVTVQRPRRRSGFPVIHLSVTRRLQDSKKWVQEVKAASWEAHIAFARSLLWPVTVFSTVIAWAAAEWCRGEAASVNPQSHLNMASAVADKYVDFSRSANLLDYSSTWTGFAIFLVWVHITHYAQRYVHARGACTGCREERNSERAELNVDGQYASYKLCRVVKQFIEEHGDNSTDMPCGKLSQRLSSWRGSDYNDTVGIKKLMDWVREHEKHDPTPGISAGLWWITHLVSLMMLVLGYTCSNIVVYGAQVKEFRSFWPAFQATVLIQRPSEIENVETASFFGPLILLTWIVFILVALYQMLTATQSWVAKQVNGISQQFNDIPEIATKYAKEQCQWSVRTQHLAKVLKGDLNTPPLTKKTFPGGALGERWRENLQVIINTRRALNGEFAHSDAAELDKPWRTVLGAVSSSANILEKVPEKKRELKDAIRGNWNKNSTEGTSDELQNAWYAVLDKVNIGTKFLRCPAQEIFNYLKRWQELSTEMEPVLDTLHKLSERFRASASTMTGAALGGKEVEVRHWLQDKICTEFKATSSAVYRDAAHFREHVDAMAPCVPLLPLSKERKSQIMGAIELIHKCVPRQSAEPDAPLEAGEEGGNSSDKEEDPNGEKTPGTNRMNSEAEAEDGDESKTERNPGDSGAFHATDVDASEHETEPVDTKDAKVEGGNAVRASGECASEDAATALIRSTDKSDDEDEDADEDEDEDEDGAKQPQPATDVSLTPSATAAYVYVDVFNSQDKIVEQSTFEPQPIKDNEGNDTGLIIWHSKIVSKGGEDADAGRGNAINGDTGAEGADVESVNNCIDAEKGFGYNAMPFGTKVELKVWCKSYFGKLRKYYAIRGKDGNFMTDFKAKARRAAKWLLVNFKECSAYAPKSFETENALIFEYWDDEANASGAPAFVAFEPGLVEVKY